MATIKNEEFAQYFILGGGLLNTHFLKKCSVEIPAMIQHLKPNFILISHYKSMETLSCYSNKSNSATSVKTPF